MCKDPELSAIIPYGYSILDYARCYDEEWNEQFLNELRRIFERHLEDKRRVQFIEKTVPSNSRKNHFPTEIVFQIMLFVDDKALVALSRVCREWYSLSSKNCLWERLLNVRFSLNTQALIVQRNGPSKEKRKSDSKHPISAKKLYQKMYQGYQKVIHQELYGVTQAFSSTRTHFLPSAFIQNGAFTAWSNF